MDIFGKMQGGVGGRMLDALAEGGYNTGAISVSGTAPPLVSKSTPLLVVSETKSFNIGRLITADVVGNVLMLRMDSYSPRGYI